MRLLHLVLLFTLVPFKTSGQTVLSDCLEEVKFTLVFDKKNFGDAKDDCTERSATLARISSTTEHSFVKSFFDREGLEFDNVWIGKIKVQFFDKVFALSGLEDVNGNGGTAPTRFTYVDGSADQSFYEGRGDFPWGPNQPNNADGNQNCVEYGNRIFYV